MSFFSCCCGRNDRSSGEGAVLRPGQYLRRLGQSLLQLSVLTTGSPIWYDSGMFERYMFLFSPHDLPRIPDLLLSSVV